MKPLSLLGVAILVLVAFGRPASQYAHAAYFDHVETADWSVSIRGIERRSEPLLAGSDEDHLNPTGQFVIVLVDLTNRSESTRLPAADDFRLFSTGIEQIGNLSASVAARALAHERGYAAFDEPVPSGATVQTVLLFDAGTAMGTLKLAIPAARTVVDLVECHCNLPSPVRTISPWQAPD